MSFTELRMDSPLILEISYRKRNNRPNFIHFFKRLKKDIHSKSLTMSV